MFIPKLAHFNNSKFARVKNTVCQKTGGFRIVLHLFAGVPCTTLGSCQVKGCYVTTDAAKKKKVTSASEVQYEFSK